MLDHVLYHVCIQATLQSLLHFPCLDRKVLPFIYQFSAIDISLNHYKWCKYHVQLITSNLPQPLLEIIC